jgi:hypothetical protein
MLQQQRLTTVLLSRLQYAIDIIDGVRGVQRDRNDDYIEFRAQARAPTPEYAEGAMELFVDFWTNGGGGGGDNSCEYAYDGECDDDRGTGLCARGTDSSDCDGVGR